MVLVRIFKNRFVKESDQLEQTIVQQRQHDNEQHKQDIQRMELALAQLLNQVMILRDQVSSPAASNEPFLTANEYELLMLELHSILRLEAACFAKTFERILPLDKDLANPAGLMDAAITNARRKSLLYETKMQLAAKYIPIADVNEDQLLIGFEKP